MISQRFEKSRVLRLSGLILSLVILGGLSASAQKKIKAPVIAEIGSDGKTVSIRGSILNRKLASGVQAEKFGILKLGRKYQLLRTGQVRGKAVVESVPLTLQGSRLLLTDLKWITTCSAGECTGFCTPDGDHCDCFGDSTSIDEAMYSDWDDDFDGNMIDASSQVGGMHSPGADGGCTFGSRAGGVYDVVVIH